MKHWIHPLRAHPRLFLSLGLGAAVAWLIPPAYALVDRSLVGWNVAVWLYLALVAAMMVGADPGHLRRSAQSQAESALTVLGMVTFAAVVSLLGIVVELSAAKLPGAPHALPHVLFALLTVCGSWLLVPTMFALTYASLYYRSGDHGGLRFPDPEPGFEPDYLDFTYFAFTLAVASQTADVSVTGRPMRRLVLLQSLLSFAFNTAILAFTVNVAASMF
jgi:uncharacterized membrane protein